MLVDLRMGRVETEYQRNKLGLSYPKRDRRNPEAAAVSDTGPRRSRVIHRVWNLKSTAGSSP